MAVAAGLPDGMHVAAAGALVRDAAERRRPAALDAVHDLQRDGVEPARHARAESLPVRHAGLPTGQTAAAKAATGWSSLRNMAPVVRA